QTEMCSFAAPGSSRRPSLLAAQITRLPLGHLRPQPERMGDQLGHESRRAEAEILFKAPADVTHDVANRPCWVADLVCLLHNRLYEPPAPCVFPAEINKTARNPHHPTS